MEEIIRAEVAPGTLAVHWLGQNSFVFKGASGKLVGLDLYLSRERDLSNFVHPEPPVSPDQMPLDYVFCTHDHGDHTDPHTLPIIAEHSPKALFLGTPEAQEHCIRMGIAAERTRGLQVGETVELEGLTVKAFRSPVPEGTSHYGYLFDFDGITVYNMGDSGPEGIEDPDAFLAPVAAEGPEIGMFPVIGDYAGRRPDHALTFGRAAGVKAVIPTHYSCFRSRTIEPAEFLAVFEGEEEIVPVAVPYNEMYVYAGQ